MKYVFQNLLRNRRVSLMAALAVLALTVFLLVFANSIRKYREELTNTYATMEVSAHFESGSPSSYPVIQPEVRLLLLDSGFIKSAVTTAQCSVFGGDVLRAVDDPAADTLLQDALPYIEWMEGYDASVFSGEELVCLAPRTYGTDKGLGSSVKVQLNSETAVALQVVGLYTMSSSRGQQVYYCPLEGFARMYTQHETAFTYNSMEMTLQNLQDLEEFKRQMLEYGLDQGTAQLIIHDSLLQQVTGQLKQQISLMQSVLPVLLLTVAAIGLGLSFLLLRGRKKEAAILRSLGLRRWQVCCRLTAETALQAALGIMLGAVIIGLMLGASAVQLPYLALLWLCYLLGGAVAAWKISGVNVFNIMTARE